MTTASPYRWAIALLLLSLGAGNANARDEEYQRLLDRFNQVATDPPSVSRTGLLPNGVPHA